MSAVFADSWYYLALLNPRDSRHAAARTMSEGRTGNVVTTRWVLAEVGDALCRPADRPRFVTLLEALNSDPGIRIVPADDRSFEAGAELYRNRPDKEWSLTDCISFSVMKGLDIRDALTADAHFEQAGFVALFKMAN